MILTKLATVAVLLAVASLALAIRSSSSVV